MSLTDLRNRHRRRGENLDRVAYAICGIVLLLILVKGCV
jgi:hypothetical protein